jgi:hypothetical protein
MLKDDAYMLRRAPCMIENIAYMPRKEARLTKFLPIPQQSIPLIKRKIAYMHPVYQNSETRDAAKPGVMEKKKIFILPILQYSNTPLLQYSIFNGFLF